MSSERNRFLSLELEPLENRLLLAAEAIDLAPGPAASGAGYVGSINDKLIVSLEQNNTGRELYLVDESRNLSLLKDINPNSADSNPFGVTPLGDKLIFHATRSGKQELWVTDGTSAGTEFLGVDWNSTSTHFIVDGQFYALVFNFTSASYEVIVSDGTRTGTHTVLDVGDEEPELLTGGSEVYVWQSDSRSSFHRPIDSSVRIWHVGDTSATTRSLVDQVAFSSWATVTDDGSLFYEFSEFDVAFDPSSGAFPTNVTETIFKSVARGTPQPIAADFHGSRLIMGGSDLVVSGVVGGDRSTSGVYRTDGTTLEFITESVGNPHIIEDRIVFIDNDSQRTFKSALFAIDGTDVVQLDQVPEQFGLREASFGVVGDHFYYLDGGDVWRTDGTQSGTTRFWRTNHLGLRIERVLEGPDGDVYFEAANQRGRVEVWKSNGSFLSEDIIFLPLDAATGVGRTIQGFHEGRAVMAGRTAEYGREIYLEDTPVEFAENGFLTIDGTAANDDISIIRFGDEFIVNVNGEQSTVPEIRFARINSRGGDDKIRVAVASLIDAGSGNDFIIGSFDDDIIMTGSGDDTVFAMGGNDVLDGSTGNDRLYGISGNNEIRGGTGNDNLFGGSGDDEIDGGVGNDTILGLAGNDVIVAAGGEDFVAGGRGDDMIFGGADNDRLFGNTGNDEIYGESGDDLIFGVEGSDLLRGGDGDDELFGMGGSDRIYGDNGNDLAIGHGSSDVLYGGLGNDRLFGGDSDDSLFGDNSPQDEVDDAIDGDDELFGGGGNDRISGQGGDDRIVGNSGTDTLAGDDGADMIFGDEDRDNITGGQGLDTIFGGGGDDRLRGGDGQDKIYGELGNDDIHGDEGHDLIEGGAGNDTLRGDGGIDTIRGGTGNDFVHGGFGNNKLFGNEGDDLLFGQTGHDQMDGGIGDDMLIGGVGNDTLRGGLGDDVLVGGINNDKLYGDEGSDLIVSAAMSTTQIYQMASLHDVWRADTPYSARRNTLRNGRSSLFMFAVTYAGVVNYDANPDQVFGGDGQDWIFANMNEIFEDDGDDIES